MSRYFSAVILPGMILTSFNNTKCASRHSSSFSVDFRHKNTLPSLPLIFIFDSSVDTTFFQYVIVLFTNLQNWTKRPLLEIFPER